MASKYLRELAMRAFNDFWCTRVPGLAPTAGYPRDARRFKTAIEPLQRAAERLVRLAAAGVLVAKTPSEVARIVAERLAG